MPDSPAAEIAIDETLVRGLLRAQAPDAAARPLVRAASGWDCETWRLGGDLAMRLPRRGAAAPLLVNEHAVLPVIAELLRPSRIGIPAPVVRGTSTEDYPWRWSVVPWFDGTDALAAPRAGRTAWAERLATALSLLHVPAPADHPVNPVRGVPLAVRHDTVIERLDTLRQRGTIPHPLLDAAADCWHDAVTAPPHTGPPMWIHGDLHPGNLVVRDGGLAAIIDFGDVTAGDPAYDLAVAWLAFDATGRHRFRSALADRYDDAIWMRTRGWAVAVAILLLHHSDDAPAYARLGAETLAEAVG